MTNIHRLFYLGTISYVVGSICLFVYSFTQVDLSLTLTQNGLWQSVLQSLQRIGYFHRPLSTGVYLVLLVWLFSWYGIWLLLLQKYTVSRKHIWSLIVAITLILVLSYPAFSYDIFNYLFTAKTVLVYGKNPYEVIPLNFTGFEPWLSFMRWTHLPSAYTPLWIGLSIIPFFFGFGYFLLILWNVKILIAAFYLLTVYAIERYLEPEGRRMQQLGMVLFALNPLVLIECLVSGHNDIVMMGLALTGLVILRRKSFFAGYLFIATSVAIKLMTICLYPVILLKKRPVWLTVAMTLGLVVVIAQREFLPWYFLWILPCIALVPENRILMIVSFGVSVGLLLRYVPVLYVGGYADPVNMWRFWLGVVPVAISALVVSAKILHAHARKSS